MSDEFTTHIYTLLTQAFSPEHLEIIDESDAHRGHQGAQGGARHYHVVLVSKEFEGKTKLACHRAVNAALANELKGPIHALKLTTHTPSEWANRR